LPPLILYIEVEFRYNFKKGELVRDGKQNIILNLLTASGSSIEVSSNIGKAISLAHEILKEDALESPPSLQIDSEWKKPMSYSTQNSCIDGVIKSLQEVSAIKEFDIYSGFVRNSYTSQVGAGIMAYTDGVRQLKMSALHSDIKTIGEIELEGLLLALKVASTQLQYSDNITIYTSAKYAMNSVSLWSYKWKSNGWRKSGGAIKNLKTIQEAHALFDKIKKKVSFCFVEFSDKDEISVARQDILRECRILSNEAISEKIYGAKITSANIRL